MQVIARGTPGFSGADLANLINIAALKSARDGLIAVRSQHTFGRHWRTAPLLQCFLVWI